MKLIDPNKQYTCNGKRVIGLRIVPYNSLGRPVSYPVKGSVVLREKPFKTEYRIWGMNGEADVVWPDPDNDLAEVVTP